MKYYYTATKTDKTKRSYWVLAKVKILHTFMRA